MKKLMLSAVASAFLLVSIFVLTPRNVSTHCDGLDGPVVIAARQALESGSVNPALIWVQPDDEDIINDAFREVIEIRKLNPDAKAMADRCFYETLVRIHRAGEGAAYTGLKPAGRDLGPAIPAADNALKNGNLEHLNHLLTQTIQQGLAEKFQNVIEKKNFAPDDVRAGREFVEAYVSYIHYAEGLYSAAMTDAEGHFLDKVTGHEEH